MQTEVDNDALILQTEVLVDNSIERKDYKTFVPHLKQTLITLDRQLKLEYQLVMLIIFLLKAISK